MTITPYKSKEPVDIAVAPLAIVADVAPCPSFEVPDCDHCPKSRIFERGCHKLDERIIESAK